MNGDTTDENGDALARVDALGPPAAKREPPTLHDLRTSLTVIKGQAQLINRCLRQAGVEGSAADRVRRSAAIIDETADRLSVQIDQLRRDAGRD